MCNIFQRNQVFLGGESIVIQINESLLGQDKHHRSRAMEHEIWVFGLANAFSSLRKLISKQFQIVLHRHFCLVSLICRMVLLFGLFLG